MTLNRGMSLDSQQEEVATKKTTSMGDIKKNSDFRVLSTNSELPSWLVAKHAQRHQHSTTSSSVQQTSFFRAFSICEDSIKSETETHPKKTVKWWFMPRGFSSMRYQSCERKTFNQQIQDWSSWWFQSIPKIKLDDAHKCSKAPRTHTYFLAHCQSHMSKTACPKAKKKHVATGQHTPAHISKAHENMHRRFVPRIMEVSSKIGTWKPIVGWL